METSTIVYMFIYCLYTYYIMLNFYKAATVWIWPLLILDKINVEFLSNEKNHYQTKYNFDKAVSLKIFKG